MIFGIHLFNPINLFNPGSDKLKNQCNQSNPVPDKTRVNHS